jgi:hypothetical protein
MWIILLDHSGSMGDPFSAIVTGSTRRVREVEADIKLAAAKEVLIEEIEELGVDIPVVIFGFTSEAHLVFEGTAGQKTAIRSSLDSLAANNGTNIAAALNVAAEYRLSHETRNLARVVLISDGKSDRDEAKSAARKCLEAAMSIHFILIDPTEDGKTFAREVVGSVGGTSFIVASRTQLQETAKSAVIGYQKDQARAEAFLQMADEQAATVMAEAEYRERVEFTAGYPSRIRSNYTYSMRVWVHLEEMRKEVEHRLKELETILDEMPRASQAESNVLIPIGTRLEITPKIEKLIVNPSQQQLTWFGEIEEAIFQIRHEDTQGLSGICSGFIEVTTAGLLIAQIPVSISIGHNKSRLSWKSSTAEMISRVFASYAREDLAIVRGCKTAYKGLGIHLFIDKDEIVTGQPWREVIRRSIGNHDLFQLFWSQAAADSSEVANEWHLALSIAPQRDNSFIRPLYWTEPMPEPPTELAHINFTFMDVNSLSIESKKTDYAEVIPLRVLEADFPVMDVIGSGKPAINALCQNMNKVVPFLEHLMQVRYYPPVSFLVDKHTVLTAHEIMCSSIHDADEHDVAPIADYVTALLQSLALAFHVGKLAPEESRYRNREVFFGVSDDEERVEFLHVARMMEWVFVGPVRQFFGGQDILKNQTQSMRSCLEAVERDDTSGSSGYDVERMLKWLLEIISSEEQKTVKNILTEALFSDLTSFEKRRPATAARKLLDTAIPELAAKYRVFAFFHNVDKTKLRLCKTFSDYIGKICKRWLAYVDVTLSKQGDVVIDIGYSAPLSSLEWLAHELPNVRIIHKREERILNSDEPNVQFDLRLSDYRTCVQYLSELLLKLLDQRESYIGHIILPIAASTYGVFLPASAVSAQNQFNQTLSEYGWPKQAGLPGQGKVLVCNDAIQNIREKLVKMRSDETSTASLTDRIALAVLVHEHFHAAIATAIDRDGRLPLGSQRWEDWQEGSALNESLAAWAERHFFRQDREMSTHIDGYIRTGEFPEWPYRGADFIEEVFWRGGLPSVRGWIQYLRDDPVNAQKEFDSQIGGSRSTK